MIYNEKYERYIDSDYVVYKMNNEDKLVQCKVFYNTDNYAYIQYKGKTIYLHRLFYETFKGEIPKGYEIDHIDGVVSNNSVDNLKCVTHKENMKNKNTSKKLSDHAKSMKKEGQIWVPGEFGKKFIEHYGFKCTKDKNLYNIEYHWYHRHNKKCRWE